MYICDKWTNIIMCIYIYIYIHIYIYTYIYIYIYTQLLDFVFKQLLAYTVLLCWAHSISARSVDWVDMEVSRSAAWKILSTADGQATWSKLDATRHYLEMLAFWAWSPVTDTSISLRIGTDACFSGEKGTCLHVLTFPTFPSWLTSIWEFPDLHEIFINFRHPCAHQSQWPSFGRSPSWPLRRPRRPRWQWRAPRGSWGAMQWNSLWRQARTLWLGSVVTSGGVAFPELNSKVWGILRCRFR